MAVAQLILVRPMRLLIVLASLLLAGCVQPVSDAELDRMVAAGKEADRTGICEIHHVAMERRVAKVMFGYPYMDDRHFAVFNRHFPHTSDQWHGDCVPDPKIAREKHYVYICPECKRAQRSWALNHPNDPYAQLILKDEDPDQPLAWAN